MSADLRFVPDAAQTHPHKFSAERIGNRLAETGLPHARWSDETKNRAVSLRVQLADREIFDQPTFYFFKIVMISIQDLLRLIKIKIVLAQFRPRQLGDRFDVADDHRILRTGRRDNVEAPQFPV